MCADKRYFDVAIVGGGPAGLAAAIYAARARRKTMILDKALAGGQVMFTALIENYPGFPKGSSGMELADLMAQQARNLGVPIEMEEARGIERDKKDIILRTDKGEIVAKALIIATGSSWKKLNVPGEAELSGRGVSYCGTCDAMLYRDKEIVVVGGGDTAIDEALFLTRFVKRLHIVHRRGELRAEKILQERAFANEKIGFIWDSVVTKIVGDQKVSGVELLNKKTNETSVFPTEGVFIFVGNEPNTGFVPEMISKTGEGQIIVNIKMETNAPGIYAAGDVRAESIRQVVSAAGDGATAAWYADKYLDTLE
ncbi:MAG TPA: thioredoxin-disulfide reductase [Candidatus Sumerlaeota bacterium]|jgi:thioredoxin reductase (NADPH)|nr:MAG: Thioredoxin reductase [candidate division BRC1 bacterium ADurb.Bin183]HOE62967.1 thioredoxin-disulfide reductase [Candidatus Sumerlaeota bacterium]HRR32094.1 thioredoxin-disulfide reductase [Candidatus Sumerlaeia bacterium]HON49604.1 thioredoxin-disulfide reductase [Candidatus Sumerlaeota bacterium]HOR64756.1 thioredoxin-disulfide reductase [Candidatus Sumerlaeota bacterium]